MKNFFENPTPSSFESNPNNKEKEISPEKEPGIHFDAMVLFGGGLNESKEDFSEISEEEGENFANKIPEERTEKERKWAKRARTVLNIRTKVRALAALDIMKKGEVDEVFVTGGKVVPDQPSEAELIRDYIARKYQIELKKKIDNKEMDQKEAEEKLKDMISKLKLEDKATNTIENFANVVDMMEESPKEYDNIAFLSNRFHLSRITQLGEKFGVNAEEADSEEEVKKRSHHHQEFLERACDTENPIYKKMLEDEKKFSRALEELPLYYLPQAAEVNQEKLEEMYKKDKESIDEALKRKGLTWEEFKKLPYQERLKLREMPSE